jgi:hypothetical protein
MDQQVEDMTINDEIGDETEEEEGMEEVGFSQTLVSLRLFLLKGQIKP